MSGQERRDAERPEAISKSGVSALHHLQLFLPFAAACNGGSQGNGQAVLEQTRARHDARVYAYVLMPEHVHLLVNEPPQILLAQFLKVVKQMTSRKLRGERKKFWQDATTTATFAERRPVPR